MKPDVVLTSEISVLAPHSESPELFLFPANTD